MKQLIQKYNVPGPRYTSYPTVPYWNPEGISTTEWKESVQSAFQAEQNNGISLYIHLPFCESLCTFCGCHKHITKQHSVETPYIETVLKEWQLYLKVFGQKPLLKEIHLGGGTPTFFSPESLHQLITGILANARIDDDTELGFEGHPNNTRKEHLETLSELGFKRVSFGVQDYDPAVQKAIHRIQPFENVEKVHNQAKAIGYDSISHDLVFGLPKQTRRNLLETIELTNQLRPDRISLYSYAHVPWIKGVGQRGYDESDLPKDEEKRILYELAKEKLLSYGYHEIGMDHFALSSDKMYKAAKNHRLHRNFMGYTTNETKLMIGLGMSSISDSWTGFAQNVKTVKEYTELVNQGEIPIFRGHRLSEQDLSIRAHILQLMCRFETQWEADFPFTEIGADILKRLNPLEEDGLIIVNPKGVKVTPLGEVFIRNICMCFDLYLHTTEKTTQRFSKTI